MAGSASVGVDDDLAPGQAGVAHRPAGDEPAGGVHQHEIRLLVALRGTQLQRHLGAQHVLDHIGLDLVDGDVGIVLGGDQQPLHLHRHEAATL